MNLLFPVLGILFVILLSIFFHNLDRIIKSKEKLTYNKMSEKSDVDKQQQLWKEVMLAGRDRGLMLSLVDKYTKDFDPSSEDWRRLRFSAETVTIEEWKCLCNRIDELTSKKVREEQGLQESVNPHTSESTSCESCGNNNPLIAQYCSRCGFQIPQTITTQ